MRSKPNLIWIVVDSVRYYRGDNNDARDRLDIMDKLARDSIEFTTMITSAPTSIMSIGTMMTGIPSYYLGRDYDTFCFDSATFYPLSEMLRAQGYNIYSIFAFRDARESFGDMLGIVGREFWPPGLKYSKRVWTNDEIQQVLFNLLDKGLPEPFFLYVHFNSRQDFQTSEKVERAINRLKGMGFYEDSVFILCPDHGYPDERRGVNEEWQVRHKMTHDLMLTDDNIRIPFFLRYPGSIPQKIDTMVTTLDLLPTLVDVLGLEDEKSGMRRGKSLLPLIESKDPSGYQHRKVRSDCRFMLQSFRRTAIRGERYKYIANHDEGTEEFYDLVEDSFEETNLVDKPELADIVEEYRQEFHRIEQDALAFHFQLAVSRVTAALTENGTLQSVKKILVVAAPESPQLELLLNALDTVLDDPTVDIWTVGAPQPEQSKSGRYDLVVTLLDTLPTEQREGIMKRVGKIRKRRSLALTANFDVQQVLTRSWWFYVKFVYSRRWLYLKEPELFWRSLVRKIRHTFNLLEHG